MRQRFTSLPFVVYPVTDMARARAFYQGVLGLDEGQNWEDKFVEFSIGSGANGTVLAVSTVMDNCQPGAKGAAAALETDQFDDVVAHLRANGVKIIFGPTDTGVCDFARFEDPDGNHLVLHRKHGQR